MSLRDELQRDIRWRISTHKALQEAYDSGEYERLLALPPQETTTLLLTVTAALRDAIFRLADEVEALKLEPGR